jgi:hypothetical protein
MTIHVLGYKVRPLPSKFAIPLLSSLYRRVLKVLRSNYNADNE